MPSCGQVVPVYETKKESKLQDFVEVSRIPFDQVKAIVGLGNKKPKASYQKQRQRLLEKIDKEKDEDIKAALKRGAIVEIIEDSMNY
jgi:ribosomal protein L7/L12